MNGFRSDIREHRIERSVEPHYNLVDHYMEKLTIMAIKKIH